MWTKKNRRRYERRGLRYESDLTDEEYALIEQFLPPERSISRRSYFPPKSTTHDYFVELHCTGVLTKIHHALYATERELEGKDPTPTLAIVDSQTVKSAEKGGQRLIRPDMTRARKSKARNDTRPSIRSVS